MGGPSALQLRTRSKNSNTCLPGRGRNCLVTSSRTHDVRDMDWLLCCRFTFAWLLHCSACTRLRMHSASFDTIAPSVVAFATPLQLLTRERVGRGDQLRTKK